MVLPAGNRGYQLAVLVLVGCLTTVWLFARGAGERELELAKADFVAEANQLSELLRQRLLTYELTARGGVSLFASVSWPSAAQWQDYTDSLRIGERGLGMLGLGYAAYLTPDSLAALQLELRAAGQGMYQVQPRGVRERYGPVVYIAPSSGAASGMVGYDLYSEPMRRAAMQAARDAGDVRLSGPAGMPVNSGGDADPRSVLLLFAPVYAGGGVPSSQVGRRAGLQGWVYVPFETAGLVQSALAPVQRSAHVRIVDVDGGTMQEIYADPGYADVAAMRRTLVHGIEYDMHGRRWRMEFAVPQGAPAGRALPVRQATLLAGTAFSFLLFAIVWVLALTQSRAERLAARMSDSYRRSEVRFRSAMEYSAIGTALLDHAGRIMDVNPALVEVLGVDAGQLRGRSLDRWFVDEPMSPPDGGGRDDGVVRATRELRRPDGGLRHAQLTYAPVPGDIGSGVARLVQVEDVTERLRAESRVRELNRTLESSVAERTRELRQANRELESFAYSVSHDLRAPLRTIDGFSRMLHERYQAAVDATGRDYLSRIRAATLRMDALIDALLTMSRLSRAELRHVPLDLSRMAEEIVADLRQSDPEREVEVAVQPGLHAHGDAALVRNLLQNLIGNAWKFTARTPRAAIEVGCERRGDGSSACYVRDNGAGFSQEYATKLFRPFQRLHGQDEFAGHGIGLASVKRVVERHGGEVWAEGEPGRGACFWFRLPDEPPQA